MIGKEMMMNRLRQQIDLRDSPVPRLARELAEREARQADVVARIADSAGVDVDVPEIDPDQRAAVLLEASEAALRQEFPEWYWSTIAPNLMDSPDVARQYIALGTDEYRETLEAWYRSHYENGTVDVPLNEADRAEIGRVANLQTQSVFGLTLDEFIEHVVTWTPEQGVRLVLAGPLDEQYRMLESIESEL